jgi:hypothetical protein
MIKPIYSVKYLNKWSGVKQAVVDRVVYDSGFEGEVARELELRRKAGELAKVERQVKCELEINGVHIANYYVDFKVTHADGQVEWIEAKGLEGEVWRMKWKMFVAIYWNDNDLFTVLKQNNTAWKKRQSEYAKKQYQIFKSKIRWTGKAT